MPNPRKRNAAVLSVFVAAALALTGCGNAEDASDSAVGETGMTNIDVKLEDGGFADSTPSTFRVPAGSLILINAQTGRGGPFRLSVLSRSTAQTFKLKSNDSLNLTLDSLKTGEIAKLISDQKTVKIVLEGE